MAKIEKIKSGDTLFSIEGRGRIVYKIIVLSIDMKSRTMLAYWDGAIKIPQRWNERQMKKLQYKEPK